MNSMNIVKFVDTNVLLYAISTVAEERSKQERALDILDADDVALSVQVLQEFYVQATRASKLDHITHEQAVNLIESWLRFHVQGNTVALMQAALSTKRRWNISYWDAAIVEAARATASPILLTEDLQHDMDFAGVRVVDPFR
jgi:predicted nucleic acid-binding protein